MCSHQLQSATADLGLPHIVAAHPEQGWTLLCDGAIVFDDTGELHADGSVVPPHRAPTARLTVAA